VGDVPRSADTAVVISAYTPKQKKKTLQIKLGNGYISLYFLHSLQIIGSNNWMLHQRSKKSPLKAYKNG